MKTLTIEIPDKLIEFVVDELNILEFKGRLTVDLVKHDNDIFESIFDADSISYIRCYEVRDLWNNDHFSELEELLASRNL